jgi:galactoside 2-L-fucosyltransferase 1/2
MFARYCRQCAFRRARSALSCVKVVLVLCFILLLSLILIRTDYRRFPGALFPLPHSPFDGMCTSDDAFDTPDSLTNLTITKGTGQYVSICEKSFDARRLGNHLFNFAAMLKAASLTGRQVAMVKKRPNYQWIDSVFNISIARIDRIDQLCPCVDVTESRALAYEWSLPKVITKARNSSQKSLLICGYMQSWRYMTGVETTLRRQLRPQTHLCEAVVKYFQRIRPPSWSGNYLRVGIHIRTGDIANALLLRKGYTIPQLPFFERAVNYIVKNGTSLFTIKNGERRKLQLIVTTDDFRWSSAHLNLSSMVNKWKNSTVDINLTYSLNNTAAFDLIMLSKCDVVVMTTGTFGWWAAWLANRKLTIYYSRWPRVGSDIDKMFVRNDFFPPDWIPIDGPFFTF